MAILDLKLGIIKKMPNLDSKLAIFGLKNAHVTMVKQWIKILLRCQNVSFPGKMKKNWSTENSIQLSK